MTKFKEKQKLRKINSAKAESKDVGLETEKSIEKVGYIKIKKKKAK